MDVAAALLACGRSQQGVATAAQLGAARVTSRALAQAVRDRVVVRVHRGVYAAGPLPARARFMVTDRGVAPSSLLHVRAALLSVGDGAVAHRRTAAAVRGWGLLVEPTRTIELAVPHGSRRRSLPGVTVTARRRVARELHVVLAGTEALPVTTAVQTVVDCAIALPLLEGVVVCDSALRSKQVTLSELVDVARALPGVRDVRRLRKVLELCDGRSGSVLESVLRARMVLAGITGFVSQRVVRDGLGGWVLRVDFCFEGVRLVVEVDGQRWHLDLSRDRSLDNQLAALGWRVLRYTWADVVHDAERVLEEIRSAAALAPGDCQSSAPAVAEAA